jgi:hypothetical protein
MFTLLMFALATAYRLQCEREARGEEPVGWRRQLLEQTRDLDLKILPLTYRGLSPAAIQPWGLVEPI